MSAMRAAVLPAVGEPLRIVSRPVPEPATGEVRVKIEACGICGSDLFLQRGGFGREKLPVVPGHEAAGVVDAIGAGVVGFAPGDQVALYYIDADPDGEWMRRGRPNLDPGLKRMGVDVDGALAEYVLRPAHTLIRPPRRVDAAALAVLTDAVATPFHALQLGRVEPGESVLVLGVGGVGSNAVQLAGSLGATVTAAGRSPSKLRLARELGAHRTVHVSGRLEEDRLIVCGRDGRQSYDVVLQCAGSAQMDELAVAAAGPGGRVVLTGVSEDAFALRASDLIWREVELIGSRGFTADDIVEVIGLYLQGAFSVDHLTRRVRPLEEANAAFDELRRGKTIRTVIDPAL